MHLQGGQTDCIQHGRSIVLCHIRRLYMSLQKKGPFGASSSPPVEQGWNCCGGRGLPPLGMLY